MAGPARELWGSLRWPLRFFAVAVVVLGLGLWLFPGAKTPLFVGFGAAAGWLAWSWWDATRGGQAAVAELRARFRDALEPQGAVLNGEDLHVMEDQQPLVIRIGRVGRGGRAGAMTATVLTPLSESTTAFRIWPRAAARPSFDGADPAVGGPLLTPLPSLERALGGSFAVEGNEPTHIMRYLDDELLASLLAAEHEHPGGFRGLTFDGRFLAVHWLGAVAGDPARTLSASSPLWRAFVPRLPRVPPSLMH